MQEAELQRLAKAREQELNYKQQMDGLEVDKQKRLAQIESERFGHMVQSLGSDTLKEMARAGPDTQVTLDQTLTRKARFEINLWAWSSGPAAISQSG